MPIAIFRFDAGRRKGLGHATRCMALSEYLRMLGWHCIAAVGEGAEYGSNVWTGGFDVCAEVKDGPRELRTIASEEPDAVIVDHYGWGDTQERELSGWAGKIVVFDDMADRPRHCDVLVNSAPGVGADSYEGLVAERTQLRLGPAFASLRPEFAIERRSRAGATGAPKRMFIGVGSMDGKNILPTVIEAISETGFEGQVDVAISSAAPHLKKVREALAKSCFNADLHLDVDQPASLMAEADIAIGTGGMSVAERFCLGLPSIIVVVADNQLRNASAVEETGSGIVIGSCVTVHGLAAALQKLIGSEKLRSGMRRAALRSCDGLGNARIADALLPQLISGEGQPISLQPVTTDDCKRLFQWQTDPNTRHYFRDPEPPSWSDHCNWLQARLDDPKCIFSMIVEGDISVGYVRLDCDSDPMDFEISIAVAPDFHGRGIGIAALHAARRLLPGARFRAWIDERNGASIAVFQRAGYQPTGDGWHELQAGKGL